MDLPAESFAQNGLILILDVAGGLLLGAASQLSMLVGCAVGRRRPTESDP